MSRRSLESKAHSAGGWRLSRFAVEVSTIPKQLDLRVQDRDALDEIELYTDVLGAVAASDGPLSRDELDEVLGVTPVL